MIGNVPATAAGGTVEASEVTTEITTSMVANWKTSRPATSPLCGRHQDSTRRPGDAADELGDDEAP